MKEAAFYFTPASDPYLNMAMDEYFFDLICQDDSALAAILRLYSWEAPAITIGYNQDPVRAVKWELANGKLPVIRRVTGGRAIYHDESEITFSFCGLLNIMPEDSRSLGKTNGIISDAVVEILHSTGISADWMRSSGRSCLRGNVLHSKACFDSLSRYEIVSGNEKIVGIAQRQKGEFFIQQGSIKINGISDCAAIGQKAGRPESSVSISGFQRKGMVAIEDFVSVFPETLSRKMGISFQHFELTRSEQEELGRRRGQLQADPLKKR